MALHKPTGNGSSGPSLSGSTAAGTWLSTFPSLLEFLTCSAWPDGDPRQLGSLILFVEGPVWKVCLKDKNGPRTCFVTGPDPDSLLLAVEEGLDKDRLDWRPDKPNGSRR